MVPRNARLVLMLSVFVLLPALTPAQSVDAMLIGMVRDGSGAALPGTTVIATAETTGLVRSAVTDRDGHYALRNLPASTYSVRAELDGFAAHTRRAQSVHVGTTVTIDFVLAVAGVAETVTVRGSLAALEPTRNSLTRIVQRSEIDALPVINRNFNDLASLAPGVTKTGVYGGVDISGSRDFQNAYQLDGVSAERHHLGDQRIAYAQDWIEEFQVLNVTNHVNHAGYIGTITSSLFGQPTTAGPGRRIQLGFRIDF
jgi:peptidoglycan hydrolase-like protein with peptidoglycan-binding domain